MLSFLEATKHMLGSRALTFDHVYFASSFRQAIRLQVLNLRCFGTFMEVIGARANTCRSWHSYGKSFIISNTLRLWILELTLMDRVVHDSLIWRIFHRSVLERLEASWTRSNVISIISVKFMSILWNFHGVSLEITKSRSRHAQKVFLLV
jgi:hypothetical protein